MANTLIGRLTPTNNMGGTLTNESRLTGQLGGVGAAVTYASLPDKPSINNVVLVGNKTTSDLNISYNDLRNRPVIPDVGEIDERLDDLEGDITSLSGRVTTAEGDITSLGGRVTTAEGNITALQGDTGALDGRLTTAEGNITTLQGDTGALDTRLTTAEGNITSLGERVTTVEGNITTLQGDMSQAQSDITQLNTSLTTKELTASNLISAGVFTVGTCYGYLTGNVLTLVLLLRAAGVATTATSVLATIKNGYRPKNTLYIMVKDNNSKNDYIKIASDGKITADVPYTTSNNGLIITTTTYVI